MTKDQQASEALKNAKEALENTDQEKYPNLYETRESLVKAMENYESQKIRAEKAEAKPKEVVEVETPKAPSGDQTPTKDYSLQDIRSLNKVHDEDVDRVEKFAKSEGISIADSLNNDDLKAIIRNREEKRKIADATHTGTGKRGVTKSSSSDLLKRAEKGEFPESDDDFDKLAEARLKKKEKSR